MGKDRHFMVSFQNLCQEAEMQDVIVDSSCCKAHHHSAGAKKGGLTHPLMNTSG